MTAVQRNLVIEKGATFRLNLRLKDSTGAYMNLTGYQGRMHVREALASETVALDLSSSFTFDAEGRCRVKGAAALTSSLTITAGVYDLEIQSPDGDVERLFEGKIKVKANVTRPGGTTP